MDFNISDWWCSHQIKLTKYEDKYDSLTSASNIFQTNNCDVTMPMTIIFIIFWLRKVKTSGCNMNKLAFHYDIAGIVLSLSCIVEHI